MSVQYKAPEPYGDDWKTWARRLMIYLGQTRSAIVQQIGGETASEDGYLMFDRSNLYPVVSQSGSYKEIAVKQAAPATSVGASGDTTGMISWDTGYIYICVADYDGTSDVWKRVTLSGASW
jgi:hypothetical protein